MSLSVAGSSIAGSSAAGSIVAEMDFVNFVRVPNLTILAGRLEVSCSSDLAEIFRYRWIYKRWGS